MIHHGVHIPQVTKLYADAVANNKKIQLTTGYASTHLKPYRTTKAHVDTIISS